MGIYDYRAAIKLDFDRPIITDPLVVTGTESYVSVIDGTTKTRNTYDVTGWLVTGYEPTMSPGGELVLTTYDILKITKTEDDLSIILWLDPRQSMMHPQGNISIQFNGTLLGVGNTPVASFLTAFKPANVVPLFKPNDPEYITISAGATVTVFEVTYLTAQNGDEYLQAGVYAATIVITNVGGLPL